MPSAKHRHYLAQAAQGGHSAHEAERALAQVRKQHGQGEGGFVPDLYEKALMVLDVGTATDRQLHDAERILADRGMAGAPPELSNVIAGMLGRIGLTVGPDGRPAPLGEDERFADAVDGMPGAQALLGAPPPPARRGWGPSAHASTFVLPAQPGVAERDIPFLVLAAAHPEDVDQLALPTSLHRIEGEVMAYARARPLDQGPGIVPVRPDWIRAVADFEDAAKIVVVLEPVPHGPSTREADADLGLAAGVPAWARDLVEQRLRAAVREVRVSHGADPMGIMIDPGAPQQLEAWAHMFFPPRD